MRSRGALGRKGGTHAPLTLTVDGWRAAVGRWISRRRWMPLQCVLLTWMMEEQKLLVGEKRAEREKELEVPTIDDVAALRALLLLSSSTSPQTRKPPKFSRRSLTTGTNLLGRKGGSSIMSIECQSYLTAIAGLRYIAD